MMESASSSDVGGTAGARNQPKIAKTE